jgi:hypothetical protein
MTHAIIIKENGMVQRVEPQNGKTFSLKELQTAVGGYIEVGRTHDGDYIVMDEEGKLKGKEINALATAMYRYNDIVVGDVLVCPTSMIE